MTSSHTRYGLVAVFALTVMLAVSLLAGCGQSAPAIEMVPVPSLAGMGQQEALDSIGAAGLQVGEIEEMFSGEVPTGTVISAMPDSVELEKGSYIDLAVSKGPEMVAIPPLLGAAEADALASLQSQGFQAEVSRSYNESVGAGLVCAMEPAPDTAIPRGSTVAVTVSQGSAYVTCGTCGGDGTVISTRTCPDCGGTGVCYT
jgi:beta-lactam-binding protein with PASTA domain